jgi:hypothetical protein
VDVQFAIAFADVRAVGRGWPVADVIEEGNPVSDLMDDLQQEVEERLRCKIEGCPHPWQNQYGPYGRLCEEHAVAAKAERDGHRFYDAEEIEQRATPQAIANETMRISQREIDETPLVRAARDVIVAREGVRLAAQAVEQRLVELRDIAEEIARQLLEAEEV